MTIANAVYPGACVEQFLQTLQVGGGEGLVPALHWYPRQSARMGDMSTVALSSSTYADSDSSKRFDRGTGQTSTFAAGEWRSRSEFKPRSRSILSESAKKTRSQIKPEIREVRASWESF